MSFKYIGCAGFPFYNQALKEFIDYLNDGKHKPVTIIPDANPKVSMKLKAELIRIDKTSELVTPANGKHFTYDELSSFVGGNIEFVSLDDELDLMVNEMGKMMELPLNYTATCLMQAISNDYVVGDALIIPKKLRNKE